MMKQNGVVVYLKSSVHDLWQRTRHDHNRPLLQTENPRAKLQELHDQRDPLYTGGGRYDHPYRQTKRADTAGTAAT